MGDDAVATTPGCPNTAVPGPLVEVDDPEDPRIGLYRELKDPARHARSGTRPPIVIVEGKLAVRRLLASTYPVRSLLVDDHQAVVSADLVAATRARGAPVFVGSRAVVAATVGFALHRGVVAAAERPAEERPEQVLEEAVSASGTSGCAPIVAILEGLNDHENIGALFRNAAAFGVSGVLLDATCADPLYRRSVRVSVGHVLRVPHARLAPWPRGLDRVRAAGFVVAALAPDPRTADGNRVASFADLKSLVSRSGGRLGVALMVGAEGPGLSAAALAASDVVVTIPMAEGADSLNVATAAAVAFHALADV
jgi:tRNA G18 (ribose-2'-O)-methylase SpoU